MSTAPKKEPKPKKAPRPAPVKHLFIFSEDRDSHQLTYVSDGEISLDEGRELVKTQKDGLYRLMEDTSGLMTVKREIKEEVGLSFTPRRKARKGAA
jgi:hypothetical protein